MSEEENQFFHNTGILEKGEKKIEELEERIKGLEAEKGRYFPFWFSETGLIFDCIDQFIVRVICGVVGKV